MMIACTILPLVLLTCHVICVDGACVLNVHLRTITPPPDCFAVMALAKGRHSVRAVYTPCGGSATTIAAVPRLAGWYNEYLNVAAHTRIVFKMFKYPVFKLLMDLSSNWQEVGNLAVNSKLRINCNANEIKQCTVTAWDPNCIMLLASLSLGRRMTFILTYTPCGQTVERTDWITLTPDVSFELPVVKGSGCWLDTQNEDLPGWVQIHTGHNGYLDCQTVPHGPRGNQYPFCFNRVCFDDVCKVRALACASGNLWC